MRYVFVLSFILIAFLEVAGQNISTQFKEGKNLFDREQYALAMSKFKPMLNIGQDNEMVRFASFYYGISAFNSGDIREAQITFENMLNSYPDWQKSEVNYWLGFISVENNEPESALHYFQDIHEPSLQPAINSLKKKALSQVQDKTKLKALYAQFPEESVASALATEILKSPVNDEDLDVINQLESAFTLDLQLALPSVPSSPKKEVYNVGLMLPFGYRDDSLRRVQMQNAWTTAMFQGARLAIDKLKSEGINVHLNVFDTRASDYDLPKLLNSGDLDELDLIIGPVTFDAVQEVAAFAKEKQINFINPLSSNTDVLIDNPFAFLYYPGNEALGLRAVEYAKGHFDQNKPMAIFYSGQSDYSRADTYRKAMEKDSFQTAIFERVAPNESVAIQQMFMEDHEVDRDSLVVAEMVAEMDSLLEAGVEDWEIYDEKDFVYDTLKILPDSIGHVFVASDFSSLSASALSGIATRPDTIGFLSSSRFLVAERSINFDQIEALDAVFVGSNYIDYNKAAVTEFRTAYLDRYLVAPVKEERLGDAYIAYDILVSFGRLLFNHGKYFQLAMRQKEKVPGVLTEYFNYRFNNDNRYMPFLIFKDGRVQILEEN